MSRALEFRAATALLKKSFSAKGASLTHTEALDLYAKLQGFEAWSHLKSSQASQGQGTPTAKPSMTSVRSGQSFGELWAARFPMSHSFPALPVEAWKEQVDSERTHLGYPDWVQDQLSVQLEVMLDNVLFTSAPVKVTSLDGTEVDWNIELDLTDRWGDFNTANLKKKSSLLFLALSVDLLNRCREAMVEEDSFIVCKDGEYGILVEAEYECAESLPDENLPGRRPRKDVVAKVLAGLADVKARYPRAHVGVADPSVVYNGRVAAWCYFNLEDAEWLFKQDKVELSEVMGCLDLPTHTRKFALAGLHQA